MPNNMSSHGSTSNMSSVGFYNAHGSRQYANNPVPSPQTQSSSQHQSPVQHSQMGNQPHFGAKVNKFGGGDHQTPLISQPRLQDLVREVDPTVQLDEDVEDMLLQLADDFIDSTLNAACAIAKHRHAATVEVKDVQLHLERQWNMWLPGFGNEEVRPYKRSFITEAHKQRMAILKKANKKH